jgi:hypothetical protein
MHISTRYARVDDLRRGVDARSVGAVSVREIEQCPGLRNPFGVGKLDTVAFDQRAFCAVRRRSRQSVRSGNR